MPSPKNIDTGTFLPLITGLTGRDRRYLGTVPTYGTVPTVLQVYKYRCRYMYRYGTQKSENSREVIRELRVSLGSLSSQPGSPPIFGFISLSLLLRLKIIDSFLLSDSDIFVGS